jgi:hypothetical protein
VQFRTYDVAISGEKYMKRRLLKIGLPTLVVVGLFGLFVINGFIYPFSSASPNYADVEAVFNKLQVPADWLEISHSEVKGIAGRQCPIESDGCFSKGKIYTIPKETSQSVVQSILIGTGCKNIVFSKKTELNGPNSTNYRCSVGTVQVSGDLVENIQDNCICILEVNS